MYGQTFYINKRQANSVTTAHLSEQNAHDKTRVQFVGTNILIHWNNSWDAVIRHSDTKNDNKR